MVSSGNSKNIIVVGSGIIGLTTACLLQQRLSKATRIIIVASEFPVPSPTAGKSSVLPVPSASADYASMWAGAHYRPIPYLPSSHPHYESLPVKQQHFQSQLANEHRLAVRTAKAMKQLAHESPDAGVEIVPAAEYLEDPPAENLALRTGDVYASPDDNFRLLMPAEIEVLNKHLKHNDRGRIRWACEYETYVVNVHVYCAWLLQRFLQRGGKTIRRKMNNIGEAQQVVPDSTSLLIVNCSGMGISHDPKTNIIRGQTVLVSNKYHRTVTRQGADGTWSFLIPRPRGGGTIIGGTKQLADTETSVRSEERQKILENAVRFFPDFVSDVNDFQIVQDNVGRRPWRKGGMRIEVDELTQDGMRLPVVHAYGAGGRGYELSWGAAEEVCDLVDQSGRLQANV